MIDLALMTHTNHQLTSTQTFFMTMMPVTQLLQWAWTLATYFSGRSETHSATNTIRKSEHPNETRLKER